jgi:hypothetical protein
MERTDIEKVWSATDSTSCKEMLWLIHPLLGMLFIMKRFMRNSRNATLNPA